MLCFIAFVDFDITVHVILNWYLNIIENSMYSRAKKYLNHQAEPYRKQTFQGEHDIGAHVNKDFKIVQLSHCCKFNMSYRNEWFTNDSTG